MHRQARDRHRCQGGNHENEIAHQPAQCSPSRRRSGRLPSVAQDYPTKAVRIVVTFPPGGSSDILARVMADSSAKEAGPARRGGQQARRRRHHRRRAGLGRGTGRRLPPSCSRTRRRSRSGPSRWRSSPTIRLQAFTHVSAGRDGAGRGDGASVRAGQEPWPSSIELDQGAEQEGVLRLGRRRLDRTHSRRDLQEGDRVSTSSTSATRAARR